MSEGKTSRAAVLIKDRTFAFEERLVPSPGRNQVLLKIKTVGICGSDVHYWAHGKCGAFRTEGRPLILGHESSGVVEAVGAGVQHLVAGDRVAIEPGVPCRACLHCRSGRYNLCQEVAFLATPPYDGSLSQYVLHAADFCFKLPDHVSDAEGALLEPLSVAVHACDRAALGIGSSVLIAGAGPIGLVCVLAAKAAGASTVIVTDINEARLKTASELGATLTLKAGSGDALQQILAATDGMGVEVSMDASGAAPAIKAALQATRPGGTFVSIGRGAANEVAIPLFAVMDKEIDLKGVFRYKNTYPKALGLVASGAVNVKPLITHNFPLSKVQQAFEVAERGEGIKVAIHVNE